MTTGFNRAASNSVQAAIVMLAALLMYCNSSYADIFEYNPPPQIIAGETLQDIVIKTNKFQLTGSTPPARIASLDEQLSVPDTGSYTQPRIEAIPTQIISAGTVVKFKIIAPIENGGNADISIDALPPNAVIDTGSDGVPVFRWNTSGTDRGERRLLFTATHPSMTDLQDTAEVLVIVENTTTSEASDMAEITDPPPLPDEPAYPSNNTAGTDEYEAGSAPAMDTETGPEDAASFTDPGPPPGSNLPSFPTESPPGYSPENQPGLLTDSPPGSSSSPGNLPPPPE